MTAAAEGALGFSTAQTDWSPAQLAVLRQFGLEDATPDDMRVLLHMAQRTGLDPFARQIYMIGRKVDGRHRYTIQTGIDGFRVVANRTGLYEGQVGPEWCGPDGAWVDVWLSDKPPSAARVGVLRTGYRAPVYAVAVFREYAQYKYGGGLTAMWAGKPSLMLAKCAEALALRKAFPQDLSGLYTDDEVHRVDVVDADPGPPQVAPPPRPAALVDNWPDVLIELEFTADLDGMRALWLAAQADRNDAAMAAIGAKAEQFAKAAKAKAEGSEGPAEGSAQGSAAGSVRLEGEATGVAAPAGDLHQNTRNQVNAWAGEHLGPRPAGRDTPDATAGTHGDAPTGFVDAPATEYSPDQLRLRAKWRTRTAKARDAGDDRVLAEQYRAAIAAEWEDFAAELEPLLNAAATS